MWGTYFQIWDGGSKTEDAKLKKKKLIHHLQFAEIKSLIPRIWIQQPKNPKK